MLAEAYGWSFQTIADMTTQQQLAALGGDEDLKFSTMQEYRAWKSGLKNG